MEIPSRPVLVGIAVSLVFLAFGGALLLLPVVCFVTYAAAGGWRFLLLAYLTGGRDLRTLYSVINTRRHLRRMENLRKGIHHIFRATARRRGSAIAIAFEEQKWTFTQLEDFANQVGNCFSSMGVQCGESIAIFMDSRPEFIALWLGMARLGIVPAFINFNLRKDALLHCIRASKAKWLVFGVEMGEAVAEVQSELQAEEIQLFVMGERFSPPPSPSSLSGLSATILDSMITSQPVSPSELKDPERAYQCSPRDPLFYIYTSGTTGMPKASIVLHQRFFYMANSTASLMDLTQKDVLYCCLPLYHTNGGVLSVGAMMLTGLTLVIRRKFSASQFWADCVRHNCTAMIYIGEICRYLLAQPPRPVDTQHVVRTAMGNGLKKNLWLDFQSRFGVTRIGEFYGATEANVNLLNFEGRVGAVGFNSVIAPEYYPVTLIRVDPMTGQVLRNDRDLCMVCKVGEPGEIVGKIIDNDPFRRFDGYVDPVASQRKVLENVLRKGDRYFRSGDILVQDEEGYYYFQDRTGDTFRWRGENVSTHEVESTISRLLGLRDVAVYGVEVPGCEGKAGMAAIVDPDNTLDMAELYRTLRNSLPSYAVPLFVRLVGACELTGTFKLKKVALTRAAYRLDAVGNDPVYVAMAGDQTYMQLQRDDVYERLLSGKMRL